MTSGRLRYGGCIHEASSGARKLYGDKEIVLFGLNEPFARGLDPEQVIDFD